MKREPKRTGRSYGFDHAAMVQIQAEMDERHWSPDTLTRIVEIMRNAGYSVREPVE